HADGAAGLAHLGGELDGLGDREAEDLSEQGGDVVVRVVRVVEEHDVPAGELVEVARVGGGARRGGLGWGLRGIGRRGVGGAGGTVVGGGRSHCVYIRQRPLVRL